MSSALKAMGAGAAILAVNAGSSSIKLGVYRDENAGDRGPERVLGIEIERIGTPSSTMRVVDASGIEQREALPDRDFEASFVSALAAIERGGVLAAVTSVGHRVVHGGYTRMNHQRITCDVIDRLRDAVPLARNHMPQALTGIECVTRALPSVPQVACFDTAFHRTMPKVAKMHALPRSVRINERVQPLPAFERFGFHGLSYEYICSALSVIDPVAARERLIVLHLGNGASVAAIHDGKSVDTTMGFTPNSGLVMGTRSGDVDPGVIAWLLREAKLPLDVVEDLLERQSGLAGLSGTTSDMRELLEREHEDRNDGNDGLAADAIALFCYRATKTIGAYASVQGGVDTIVFSGGIGERSAAIRERICAGQMHLGIRIDPVKNAAHAAVISTDESIVTVRVIHTDEESMIVRHTQAVLAVKSA